MFAHATDEGLGIGVVHTAGLQGYGQPELRMRGVPRLFFEHAVALLDQLVEIAVERAQLQQKLRPGDRIRVADAYGFLEVALVDSGEVVPCLSALRARQFCGVTWREEPIEPSDSDEYDGSDSDEYDGSDSDEYDGSDSDEYDGSDSDESNSDSDEFDGDVMAPPGVINVGDDARWELPSRRSSEADATSGTDAAENVRVPCLDVIASRCQATASRRFPIANRRRHARFPCTG